MSVAYSSGNLIVNPGAESGAAATSFGQFVTPEGWSSLGQLTSVGYSVGGGSDLNTTSGRALQGGKNYFAGGPSGGSTTATQLIDVSTFAAAIDAGTLSARMDGQFGGFSSQEDNMSMTIRFINGSGAELGTLAIGDVTAAERSSTSTLLGRFGTIDVPAGTRSIEVVLQADRLNGSYNDGYADNLSLDFLGVTSGLVFVTASKNYGGETIGPSSGISFDSEHSSTATFASSQFGAAHISRTGMIEGSFATDSLVIKVASGQTFSAGGFNFTNWTQANDRLTLKGAAGNETITGSSQQDTFTGGGGADILKGGAGNDVLDGQAGIDRLNGGSGRDTFRLANLTQDRDTIAGFSHDQDQLSASAALFGAGLVKGQALGPKFEANATGTAQGGEDRFIYNTSDGRLFFDADGSGAGARVLIATLSGAPVIDSSDITILA